MTFASGTPADPVDATRAVRTGHAFLDDIAHHASPKDSQTGAPLRFDTPADNADGIDNTKDDRDPATYDDEMLAAHFITGDGRGNENIGLTAVHHVFHAEHNLRVDEIKDLIGAGGRAGRLAAAQRRLERRAPLPGRALHHRDGVPAPRLRGVRPQGPAAGQPVRRLRDRHRPVDRGGVRAHGLPLRPLDADRDGRPQGQEPRDGRAHGQLGRPDRGLPQPGGLQPGRRRDDPGLQAGGRLDRPRHDGPDRQRDRRVRHRRAAQQPRRPAARPRDHQHGARP